MKKVFQTIVDKGNGNCLQAAVASLFELELKDVPHFLEAGDQWYLSLSNFYNSKGYDCCVFGSDKTTVEDFRKAAEHDGGVGGYFEATVKSQTFEDTYHAVVVDTNLNVVHDPNPNSRALILKPEDIICIQTIKEDWYMDEDGNIVEH